MKPDKFLVFQLVTIFIFSVFITFATIGCGDSSHHGGGDDDKEPDNVNEATIWYLDADGDGHGDIYNSVEAVEQPDGYVSNALDPDDTDDTIYDGSPEICGDGIDNDQDGRTDCDDLDCSYDDMCDTEEPDDGLQVTNVIGMTFNLLEAGTFLMGSPRGELGRDRKEVEHEVTLTKPFYMQITEVTQAQWAAVMGELPSDISDKFGMGSDYPIYYVSWNDVQDFLEVLNGMGIGTYRLPTEAEWEYACRAGSTTAFANGDITEKGDEYDENLDAIGWYEFNNEPKGTKIVAQKISNAWGLYDMHGNVYEWCADRYDDKLGKDPVTDPTGPKRGLPRVKRGGSWNYEAERARSANRSYYLPYYSSNNIGFRLVLEP